MRALGCFLLGVVAAILVIAFGLFAVENGQTIPFSFLGNTMRMSLWLLVGIPAVIGFLLALLLVTPARAAGDRHGSALRGQHRALERDLADERQRNEQLRAENSRWQAQYQRVLTERDTLNTRLAAVQQTVTAPVHETPTAAMPAHETPTVVAPAREVPTATAPVRETAAQDSTVYSETPAMVQREEPVVPVAPAASDRVAAPVARDGVAEQQPGTTDEAVQAEPPAQPTLGERLRGMFNGQRTTEEEEADRLNSRGPAPTM
ncbi:MAG: lipopolysaccharide assembly protein LapA domain-containing protein [Ktedonobacterales bacterium]